MKLFCISFVVFCVLLSIVQASSEFEGDSSAELLRLFRPSCAGPDQSCSKGSYGSGPPCCPPKGCSCNPFTRNCHCRWDLVGDTVGKVWDIITLPFGK